MTRHFSQFLFAPYGDGEGLRAVDSHPADEQLLGRSEPSGAEEGGEADAADPAFWPALTAVEWPLTHRPFDDDDEPEIADGHFAPADEDPDGEAREEAEAHAARAALLAEVYGWPHRAV
ncbi:hypothetical protein [Clavibacter capsici]|uniref:Uncharacterized protein n=1 Tax=Clavibacter capsici TaxID=1874630 RepID=A0A0M5JPE3_9MICO|nr:hypothetical protein [Clavibacter capsici]ALD11890.1 hypothetical protein AES38_02085 [Clavibacter capsici]QIS41022.1 hypothetical protein GW571_02095 [Clavibacter capsici]QIS43967.1 hypothetical protein GW570_02090 [Clavibacter capsici]